MYMITFDDVVNYINTQTPWQDDTLVQDVIFCAKKAFKTLTKNAIKSKKMIRVCGQTGSGKTTQIVASLEQIFLEQNKNVIVIGVRSFATFHPNYDQLLSDFGSGLVREKTNGFALKCLTYVVYLLIKHGYMFVLDMTLLAPIYEQFVLQTCNQNDYSVDYHVLAVNTTLSTKFLNDRFNKNGRVVLKQSADYFNDILAVSFKQLCLDDKNNLCYLWTCQDLQCVKVDKIQNCYADFLFYKSRLDYPTKSEQQLKQAKYNFLKQIYKD